VSSNPDTALWPAATVELRDVAALLPYARNARIHSEAQVAQLAAAIREWGWTVPVLIDEDGMLLAGHGRVMAARLLELAQVPVMVARGWDEAKKRAYIIADNKLAENASWDEGLLRIELEALLGDDFAVALTGFGVDEMVGLEQAGEMPDELEPLQQPNGGDSKTLQLTFGNKKVPLTDAEAAWLEARLQAHVDEFGISNGFVERSLRV